MPMSTATTGSNISLVTEGCHKEGGEKVNKKISRYMEEIEKTEKKIADLQLYLKGIKNSLKEEEEKEMVRSIRGMNLDRKVLLSFLNGLQDGSVTFQVSKKEDEDPLKRTEMDTDKEEDLEDDKTQETE